MAEPAVASRSRMLLLPVGGSLLLACGDAVQLARMGGILYTVLLWLGFLLLAPGALLLPRDLGREDSAVVRAGAILAFVGSMAGATMQALFRAMILLDAAGLRDAIAVLRQSAALRMTTQVPGIFFPVGLLVVAVGLLRSRGGAAGPGPAALLGVGAILFPVGHAMGFGPALVGSDVLLLGAFLWLGRPG